MSDAELLFDTDRAAAVVGLRAAGGTPRQLAFRHGAHRLDLLATAPAASDTTFLWGRLVVAEAGTPCEGADVAFAPAGGDATAEATTDEFGEFRLAAAMPRARRTSASATLRVDTGDVRFVCRLPSESASPSASPLSAVAPAAAARGREAP